MTFKSVAALAALSSLTFLPAFAAETAKPAAPATGAAPAPGAAPAQKGEMTKGTITKWDDATKSFTVKLDAPVGGASEMNFLWNDKTKRQGVGKVGEMVMVKYSSEEGKPTAHSIMIGKDAIAQWEARKKQSGG